MSFCWMTKREVLDSLRKGIETEHFRARVSWPQGFNGGAKLTVETRPVKAEFVGTYEFGEHAPDMMYEALTDELQAIKIKADKLIFEVECYASERRRSA